jgi:hypothetical protein
MQHFRILFVELLGDAPVDRGDNRAAGAYAPRDA